MQRLRGMSAPLCTHAIVQVKIGIAGDTERAVRGAGRSRRGRPARACAGLSLRSAERQRRAEEEDYLHTVYLPLDKGALQIL